MPRSLLALSVTACAALFASGGLARPIHAGSPPPGTNQYRLCHGPRGERRAGRRSRRDRLHHQGGRQGPRRPPGGALERPDADRHHRRRQRHRHLPIGPRQLRAATAGPGRNLAQQRRRTDAQAGRLHDRRPEADRRHRRAVRPAGHTRWRPAARRYLPDGEGSGEARGDASGDRGGHGRRRGTQHAAGASRPRPARQERQHHVCDFGRELSPAFDATSSTSRRRCSTRTST